MIEYVWNGDLFSSRSQTLTIPVNLVGVMGKGLAKECKERYPDVFRVYRELCRQGVLAKAGLATVPIEKGKQILLFPTKRHWRDPSPLALIEEGLTCLTQHHELMDIQSLAVPKLGCGAGGLRFDEVRPLLVKHLETLPFDVQLYY